MGHLPSNPRFAPGISFEDDGGAAGAFTDLDRSGSSWWVGSPRTGENQFSGQLRVDDDTLTVSPRDADGATVFSRELTPER